MKSDIIKKYGEPIVHDGTTCMAIVGRLNRSGFDMFTMENLREVITGPGAITSGKMTDARGGRFLTISVYPEYMRSQHISDVAVLLKCNVIVEYCTVTQKPDGKGNKTTVQGPKTELQGYRLQDNEVLKQFDAGMISANQVVVYVGGTIPASAEIKVNGKKYRLLGADTTSFVNVSALRMEAMA